MRGWAGAPEAAPWRATPPPIMPAMDGGRYYLGHLWQVPVFVSWTVVFLILFGYSQYAGAPADRMLVGITALLLTILLHEFGHALAALAMRLHGVEITLAALGGYCSYQSQPTAGQKLLVSVSGPLMNYLLAGIAWWIEQQPSLISNDLVFFFVRSMLWWNLILGIFNSLPLYPLDGGQSTLALTRLMSKRDATAKHVTLWASAITACGAIYYLVEHQGLTTYMVLLIGSLLVIAFADLS
jgi:Zn-dependent protease